MRSWIRAPSNNVDDNQQQPHTIGRRASSDSLSSYASSFREPRYSFAASDSESEEEDTSVRNENSSSSDRKSPSSSNRPVRRRRVATGSTAVSSSVLIRTVVHPVLNIFGTAAMIGCLLWYYNDHELWDVTASVGIEPSTAVALVITLLTVLLRSGIEYGISEYKWTRFQFRNVKLVFLDVYHSSSRGMGGILRVLFILRRFDWVVVFATIFYLGLIAVAPSAQYLLQQKPVEKNLTCHLLQDNSRPEIWISATNISAVPGDILESYASDLVSSYQKDSYMPLTINGTQSQEVIVPFGFKDFLRGTKYVSFYPPCPSDIDVCSYANVHIAHTSLECESGNLDTEIINVHTNSRMPLREYYGLGADGDHLNVRTPSFYFAGNMLNRTLYNLGNVTASYRGLERKPVPYDQSARDGVGEQTFVMVTYQDTLKNMEADGGFSANDLRVEQCTIHTAANVTTFNVTSHDQSYFIHVEETRPIEINFDRFGNTSLWSTNEEDLSSGPYATSYAYQMDIMRALIIDTEGLWDPQKSYQPAMEKQFSNIHEFLSGALNHTDLVFTFTFPVGTSNMRDNTLCYASDIVLFNLDPVSYIVFALMLIAPLVWWAILWIISLYKMNGASLGASQILLAWSRLMPVLRSSLPSNILQADQYAMTKSAGDLTVRFGQVDQRFDEHISGQLQSAAFGPEEYIQPLHQRMRRKSV